MGIQTRDQSAEAILRRIDAIVRELGELCEMGVDVQPEPPTENLAQQLYGAVGHGTWEEYDLELDWRRFDV